MPTIVIVRHGETDANRKMILQGEESRLTTLGHQQAGKFVRFYIK